jgi:plasmid stabilization system protein ParE
MARVAISLRAERQATLAFEWIAARDPVRAEHWYRALSGVLQSLELFPERCPLAPESVVFGKNIRQLTFGNYRILFQIELDRVYVIHIRHGSMSPLDEVDLDDTDT